MTILQLRLYILFLIFICEQRKNPLNKAFKGFERLVIKI